MRHLRPRVAEATAALVQLQEEGRDEGSPLENEVSYGSGGFSDAVEEEEDEGRRRRRGGRGRRGAERHMQLLNHPRGDGLAAMGPRSRSLSRSGKWPCRRRSFRASWCLARSAVTHANLLSKILGTQYAAAMAVGTATTCPTCAAR